MFFLRECLQKFSVILLASMMALVGAVPTQGVVVSEGAFAKGSSSEYVYRHDSQEYESSGGKYHHHNEDDDYIIWNA